GLKTAYAADLETVRSLKEAGMTVVTIFLSGRPMYVNEEINHSDAFVAAWLPGTEAGGIVDVLYAVDDADFVGRLSYSWPATQCDTTVNRVAPHISGYIAPDFEQDSVVGHVPLFAYGYGLSYAEPGDSMGSFVLDARDFGCGLDAPSTDIATSPLEIYGRNSGGEFVLRVSGAANGWSGIEVSGQNDTDQGNVRTSPINYQGQYDAVNVQFDGGNLAQIYLQYEDELGRDSTAYLNADSTLQFDIRVQQSPTDALNLAQHCVHPCLGELSFQSFLPEPSDQWSTLKVPLRCMADEGMSFVAMNTPFLFFTGGATEFDLGNVRIVPRSVDPAEDAFSCEDLAGLDAVELEEDESSIFGNDTWDASLEVFSARTGSDWSPVPELVSISTTGEGVNTEISVEYASNLEETDKGVVIVNGKLQNINAYVANGTLEFELYVEDYADNVSGMVVKMESSTTGPDIFIGGPTVYPAGQWHSISINIADLGLTEDQTKAIIKPFVILPAWGDSQLGVKFSFRNVVLKLNS
ncbi:MAG: putative glycoside hydrolase, partial [Granulosicoccus sp.]